MLHATSYFLTIFGLLLFPPTVSERHEPSGSPPQAESDQFAIPKLDDYQLPYNQSKYLTWRDDIRYGPVKVGFVFPHKTMSEALRDEMERIGDAVNRRLGAAIKAPVLADVRLPRAWDQQGRCYPPRCGWEKKTLSGQFAFPCRHPSSNQIIPEPHIPDYPSWYLDQMNQENFTLVIYVTGRRATAQQSGACADNPGSLARVGICRISFFTGRPTHGYIGICTDDPSALKGEKVERIILRDILHIMTMENVVGMAMLNVYCLLSDPRFMALYQCMNRTWIAQKQRWMISNGTVTERTRLLARTTNVVKAARKLFACETLDGAAVMSRKITRQEVKNIKDGWKLRGKLIPDRYWSKTAFPEEILVSDVTGGMRLSILTLALLKDMGWYQVDMDKAEPMDMTTPVTHGCKVADLSHHEVVQQWRLLQCKDQPQDTLTPNMGPYCDNEYDNMNSVINSRCYKDSEPLKCNYQPELGGISTIGRPIYYDSFACNQTSIISGKYPQAVGATVGKDTICLTVGPTSAVKEWLGICVEYHCKYESSTIQLILKPSGTSCTMICPEDMSNKLTEIQVTDASCKKQLGEKVSVICPTYCTVCPGAAEAREVTTPGTSGASILESDGYGIILGTATIVAVISFLHRSRL